VVIGGMVYHIDPDLEMPFNHGREVAKNTGCFGFLWRWLWWK